jgi:serine phosphatase RsbU (regulator of sigma subunit)
MKPGDPVYALARRLRPELDHMTPAGRVAPTGDLLGLVLVTPMALLGLVWLISLTSLSQLRQDWLLLAITAGLIFLLNHWSFFLIIALGVETGTGYANASRSFESVPRWAAVLLLGPVGLWPEILYSTASFFYSLRTQTTRDEQVNAVRNLVFAVASNTILALPVIALYQALGGEIPIQPLHLGAGLAFLVALIAHLLLELAMLFLTYLGYMVLAMLPFAGWRGLSVVVRMIVITVVVPYLASPFALLAASLYLLAGLPFYLVFFVGLLLVSYMAHSLSGVGERNRQQSTQLQRLEALGRALISAPPDGSQLPDLLSQHVSGMFISQKTAIWTDPAHPLFKRPADWDGSELLAVDAWLRANPQPAAVLPGQPLPWASGAAADHPYAVAPLLDGESGEPSGGIYLDLQFLGVPGGTNTHRGILLTLPTLAAQVSAALHRTRVYAQTLAHQLTLQELAVARQIQHSFLPEAPPQLPGWELAASLEPARQVSGDFYDFITLPDGRLGLLVADVADKGLGPALFMAVSRTLIRTFAQDFPDAPEEAVRLASARLLQDAGDNLFVTAFYGVLNPATGELVYCNAGHNPPLLLRAQPDCPLEPLRNTGMPLAVMEDALWTRGTVQITPGDMLLIYTDGVTDAQNPQGDFFDESGLRSVLTSVQSQPAAHIHAAVLDALHRFVGENAPGDDITLLVLTRLA